MIQVDASRYAGPALHLERGYVKGTWMIFEPLKWYEYLPKVKSYNDDALLRALCIASEGLEKIAKDRADIEVRPVILAVGSYGTVLKVEGGGGVVVKVFGEWERKEFCLEAVRLAVEASACGIGPRVFGYGVLRRLIGSGRSTFMLFMEELEQTALSTPETHWPCCWDQSPVVNVAMQAVEEIVALTQVWSAKVGFHNDLKIDNIVFQGLHPYIVDYDLSDPWNIKIAVTSSFIKFDFHDFFSEVIAEEVRDGLAAKFRTYYDLFCLTLSLPPRHPWVEPVFSKLTSLFHSLEKPVFRPFLQEEKWVSNKARKEIPIEVLVRGRGVLAVTVNLFDLQGNAFAHEFPSETVRAIPSLIRSHGVYWNDSEN